MTTTIVIVLVAAVAFCLGRWYGRAERADIARIVALINSIPAVVIQTCPPNCPDCAVWDVTPYGATKKTLIGMDGKVIDSDAELDQELKS